MNKGSKFNDLFEQKEQREQTEDMAAISPVESLQDEPAGAVEQSSSTIEVGEYEQATEPVPVPRLRRKPTGKRSDPDWQPFTAFGRTETLRQVEVKLITLGHKNRLSDLLEDLMTEWLKSPRPPLKH